MNLLSKKLKDKLKVFDEIDKQYIMNIKAKNNPTAHNLARNKSNNSTEVIKKTTKEKFNKIYSDFYLNENVFINFGYGLTKKNNLMNNNLDKDPTNENSFVKEQKIENNKTSSVEKYILSDEEERAEKQIEVGDRLYNYSIYLRNKLENQRRIQENKIKQLTRPKISIRAKSIVRDPHKIGERLYQNYKKNEIKDKSGNKSCIDISNKNISFSFHPKINKKSISIANKLEPSFLRLNKKKKRKYENESEKKNYYKNLLLFTNNAAPNEISFFNNDNDIINYNHLKKEKKNKCIFKKMNNLYLRGMEQRKKKEQLINDIKKKKEEDYKKYTFKPKINKNICLFNRNENNSSVEKKKKNNSKNQINNIYKKNIDWKKRIQNKNSKEKENMEENELKLCTFKPKILSSKSPNINKINKKVLEQMNDYINNRRKNIKYKTSEENYKKRRLGDDISEFIIKSTIPHEFIFEVDKRNCNLNKNKNRSCDNFHKKNINLLLVQNSDKRSLTNENYNNHWIFKEEMNNCNTNNNISTSNKLSEKKSQNDFIEAVNLLHQKLYELNI